LLDVASGKISAQTDLGSGPELGLSPKGDIVAVLTYNRVGGAFEAHNRLQTFRTSDLKRLENGLLPFPGRIGFQDYPRGPTIGFSPDGKEIIVQRMESFLTHEKPLRWPVENNIWGFAKLQLSQDRTFVRARADVRIPRCRYATFLRTLDWPIIQIWNPLLGVVEVVDVGNGKILSRLPLDYSDDRVLNVIDPQVLEKPEIGELYTRLGSNGNVIYGGHQHAYYVPHPSRNPKAEPGFLMKIDVVSSPPKTIGKGEKRQAGLWPAIAAASDSAGAIFVAAFNEKFKFDGPASQVTTGVTPEASNRVRIYSTRDLRFLNEIELSMAACDSVAVSDDGKYLYALNRLQARVVVVDVASGSQVKIVDGVGGFPAMMLPLPSAVQ
jgi:hypothetical protein